MDYTATLVVGTHVRYVTCRVGLQECPWDLALLILRTPQVAANEPQRMHPFSDPQLFIILHHLIRFVPRCVYSRKIDAFSSIIYYLFFKRDNQKKKIEPTRLETYITRQETVIVECSLKHRPITQLKTHKQHYYHAVLHLLVGMCRCNQDAYPTCIQLAIHVEAGVSQESFSTKQKFVGYTAHTIRLLAVT